MATKKKSKKKTEREMPLGNGLLAVPLTPKDNIKANKSIIGNRRAPFGATREPIPGLRHT